MSTTEVDAGTPNRRLDQGVAVHGKRVLIVGGQGSLWFHKIGGVCMPVYFFCFVKYENLQIRQHECKIKKYIKI